MLFYLVELVPSPEGFRERRLDTYGPYEDGREAALVANELSSVRRHKVQPRRGDVAPGWEEAVTDAFDAFLIKNPGARLFPPWTVTPIPNHFAHLHPNDDTIGYYPTPAHAVIARPVYMAPGRYLREFYPDLSYIRAAAMIAALDRKAELSFARDPDAVERVYRIGPGSCMKDEKGDVFADDGQIIHKPRIYGGPDLAVAYLTRGERITARSVVWPERKLYGRVYGDADRLINALDKLGYAPTKTFDGARLEPILANPKGVEKGDAPAYALPFFDNIGAVVRDAHGFRASPFTPTGSGLLRLGLPALIKEPDGLFRSYAFCPLQCSWCAATEMTDDHAIVGLEVGRSVSRRGIERYTFICAKDGRRYNLREEPRHTVETPRGTELWSGVAFTAHGFACPMSGRNIERGFLPTRIASDGTEVLESVLSSYEDGRKTYENTRKIVGKEATMAIIDDPSWQMISPSISSNPITQNIWFDVAADQRGVLTNISALRVRNQINASISRAVAGDLFQHNIPAEPQVVDASMAPPIDDVDVRREMMRYVVERERVRAPDEAPVREVRRVRIDTIRMRQHRDHRRAFEALEGRPYPASASSRRHRDGSVTVTYDRDDNN